MASLMEELLDVLSREKKGYEALLALSEEVRDAVVKNRVTELEAITAQEEEFSTALKTLEKIRLRILTDMAVVLGHDGEALSVTGMIGLLDKQPKEQKALAKARDDLIETAKKMQFRNQQNQVLLQQAMELTAFDLTLYRSLRQAPETANYNRQAYSTGDILGNSGFDTKQ